jgi:hypothetical protein
MMSLRWSPVGPLSAREERLVNRCKKAPFFVFLRRVRSELFDEAFQDELIALYPQRASGRKPPPPAMLATVTLLQAVLHTSDQEAVRLASTDRCWQMVLGTLDAAVDAQGTEPIEELDSMDQGAPFAQGTLVEFRARLIRAEMDRRLLERTVEFARTTRLFGHTALRAAFDASPLFGAGRVEDTFNLLGHAAQLVVQTVAKQLDVPFTEAAQRTGIPLLIGSSLKATLDLDWDDATERKRGLSLLLEQIESLGRFLRTHMASALNEPPLDAQWKTVEQIIQQDLEPDPEDGGSRIRKGVAKERRISVTDPDMRHGRKSKSKRFDGYKRHLAADLETDLIVAVAITRANRPEGEAADPLSSDIARQNFTLESLSIDRAYLEAPAVQAYRETGTQVFCKAFPLRNHGRYTKADFTLDLEAHTVTCPAGQTQPMQFGSIVHFPKRACEPCEQRAQCTQSKSGRSLAIHPHESQLIELRARQKTPEGRAKLRERTKVEHALAHVGQSQSTKARYLGERKNLFDLRRHAAAHNVFVAMREAA